MSGFLNKMQNKFGKYAVPHLTAVIVGCYAIGYIMRLINPDIISYMTLEPYLILHGQVWRLITWLVIPPTAVSIFTIITLFFYFSIGTSLERAWGDFRYNVYIFGGIFFTIIAAFLLYFVFEAIWPGSAHGIGSAFSTYYISMSIFLGFAATFPDAQVLLYFVIPLRIKWLGWIYAAFLAYDAYGYIRGIASGNPYGWLYLIAMAASLLNFVLFFFSTRNMRRISPAERKRRRDFQRSMEEGMRANRTYSGGRSGAQNDGGQAAASGAAGGAYAAGGNAASGQAGGRTARARHVCTVCGRTELTNPELEFRVCSKCGGFHEYCQDHLFTHEHIH